MSRSADLLVVGAGPAGLTAAWRAALAGRSVRVVDAAPVVGGMAASIEVGGQRVDLGSHRLHPSAPPHLLAALRGLLGPDLQTRVRHGRLHLRDRWIGFPLRPADLVRHLPPSFAAAAARDAITAPLRRPREDTFADVVRVGLGPTMLRDFYGPYARKLWGVDPASLAGELARRRISASDARSIARTVLRGARPSARTFLYPRLGYGQIVERLAEAATDAGCVIELSHRVDSLAGVDADHVAWTAPLVPLVQATPDADPSVRTAAGRLALAHRAVVLVYLVLDAPRYTPFDAHYVADAAIPIARLSEPKNYRDGPDPADRTVLCAELPCTPGDATWRAGDADLGAQVADHLARLGLPEPRASEVATRRLPRVYPVLGPTTLRDAERVERWASSLPGVTVLGRQALFVADSLHHVMDMGWSFADALGAGGVGGAGGAGGAPDPLRWAAARRRFRSFVVED